MIIELDTETLRQVTESARGASESVNTATEIMNRVTTHEDWACSERDLINEYITNNRRRIQELQTCADILYRAIASVLSQFESAQEETAASFGGVDSLISTVLSKTPGVISSGASSGTHNIFQDVLASANESLSSQGICGTNTIPGCPDICGFPDFSDDTPHLWESALNSSENI